MLVERIRLFLGVLLILTACGPKYLSSPPDDFGEFIESAPVLAGTEMLSEWSFHRKAEGTICTTFVNERLYGVNSPFSDMLTEFEATLEERDVHFVRIDRDGQHLYLLSDLALMTILSVERNDLVTELHHGKDILVEAYKTYDTLFVIDVEHRYGDCVEHPWWSD